MRVQLPKNVIDEQGHRYGSLIVLAYIGPESEYVGGSAGQRGGAALWQCQCDCGKKVTVRGAKLRQGRVRSCGCWKANPAVRQAAWAKERKSGAITSGSKRARLRLLSPAAQNQSPPA